MKRLSPLAACFALSCTAHVTDEVVPEVPRSPDATVKADLPRPTPQPDAQIAQPGPGDAASADVAPSTTTDGAARELSVDASVNDARRSEDGVNVGTATGEGGPTIFPSRLYKFRVVKQSTDGKDTLFFDYNFHHRYLLRTPSYDTAKSIFPVDLRPEDHALITAAIKQIRYTRTPRACAAGASLWAFAKQSPNTNTVYLSCLDPALSRGLVLENLTTVKDATVDEATLKPLVDLLDRLVQSRPCLSKDEVKHGC